MYMTMFLVCCLTFDTLFTTLAPVFTYIYSFSLYKNKTYNKTQIYLIIWLILIAIDVWILSNGHVRLLDIMQMKLRRVT